ncbi:transmembrane protein 14C-like [Macrosteles quadrilineatus]|uniref:transmembrane protein 14C-like n=1 Tax=Macrosteles quadrilineatus TaxID=74068 RepID=UPI0023E295D1|nr:transmembrane protein 14C-like [Macrosteles quadrilineatus]
MTEATYKLDYLSIGYAAFVFVEGALGYVKASSVPSLQFSGLLGVGVYQAAHNPRHWLTPLLTNYALAGAMGKRFMRSSKMYPAGYITLFSTKVLLSCALHGCPLPRTPKSLRSYPLPHTTHLSYAPPSTFTLNTTLSLFIV